MDKQEAIRHIQNLYPPEGSTTGEKLLWDVLVLGWQDLPEPLLIKLAHLNISEEMKQR